MFRPRRPRRGRLSSSDALVYPARKTPTSTKRRKSGSAVTCETLEGRTLLCGLPHPGQSEPVIELAPETIDPRTGISPPSNREVADPANIVWVNRGLASDNFDARFGASAGTARAVVDAVIVAYERMIGSFDYPSAGQTYSLTLSMGASGGGFGASAGLSTSLGGKPKSGSISMGAGNGSADANDDNGWFLDPTPFESSEFLGTIQHAYAGDAQAGSPAAGRGDFYTVVAAEMTHSLGLFGSALAGWTARTINTGQASATASPGFYWVFDGPSVKHLLTSNNAFSQDWGSAIHSSEGPGSNINFNGLNWVGTNDQGNPGYEFGRRYMVNHPFGLMFKDAYGYLSVNPARDGTMYSILNQNTGVITVRGGAGTSADNIQIFRSAGNTLTVSVNIGNDVAGSGHLPGAGSLGSFDTVYDMNQISSIVVDPGDGDDVIVIDSANIGFGLSESFTINAGGGNDSLIHGFFSPNLDLYTGGITFNGGAGTDSMTIYDNGATFSDSYTVTSTFMDRVIFGGLTYSGAESLFLAGESGSNSFFISGTPAGMSVTLEGRDGNDSYTVGPTASILGPLTLTGGNGTDSVSFSDSSSVSPAVYTMTNSTLARSGAATTTFGTVESVALTAGTADDTINLATGTGSLPISVNAGGGNDLINIDSALYTSISAQNAITLDGSTGTDSIALQTQSGGLFYNVTYAAITGTNLPSYAYPNIENLTFNGGTGNETFLLFETPSTLNTVVNGNDGADSIYFGGFFGAAYTLDTIDGPVTVNGGSGGDVMGLIDNQVTTSRTFTIDPTTIVRTSTPTITYGTTETVHFYGGTAQEIYNVNNTSQATTQMNFESGGAADTFSVQGTHPATALTIDGGAARDTVLVNTDNSGSAAVRFSLSQDLLTLSIGNGGSATLNAGGNKYLNLQGLVMGASALLDLNDGDMLVDYSGASSQFTAIRNRIATARNGGAWNGSGITSTTARNAPNHNTTLGVMESADYRGIYGAGAAFAGQTLNDNMIVVKYTYYGDADLSGDVDFDDYVRTDLGFNTGGLIWRLGDFDGTGGVDFDDYVLLDLGFNTQTGVL